jgi:hypothetical protein
MSSKARVSDSCSSLLRVWRRPWLGAGSGLRPARDDAGRGMPGGPGFPSGNPGCRLALLVLAVVTELRADVSSEALLIGAGVGGSIPPDPWQGRPTFARQQ